MPKFLKNIEGQIVSTTVATISNDNLIQGVVGEGDYMNLFKFTGYFVELSKATVTELDTPRNFGFKNDDTVVELNISY